MKRINLILTSTISFSLLLSSCSQDEVMESGIMVNDDEISFVTDMPGVSSRTPYDLKEQLVDSGFTVSAICPEKKPGDDGILSTHFEDKTVRREVDGVFRSGECRWPANTGDTIGILKFFAFHPSIQEMKRRAGISNDNNCFIYANSTVKNGDVVNYDYRLTKFRTIPDIDKHVDFVTAIGQGNKTDNLYSGIKIHFEHQLSGVEVAAWGNNSLYDIEVAGWRIGGIIIEADFGLSTEIKNSDGNENKENTIGEWFFSSDPPRGYVDYVFAPNDKVVHITASEHNTKATAVSILGGGGKAMVIPQKQEMWDHTTDKTTTPKGMYFSALVRVTQHDGDNHCVYPSKDPQSQDHIVYLSVRKSDGTVMKRLDKHGNVYGTSTKYNMPATEELRYYGWAAAPAKVEWKPGYTYSYVLDYSNGVGVHDPYDPNPAGPMIDWGGVEVTTTTGVWDSGGKIGEGGWGANSNNTAPDGTVWWK